jgi:hypothetical protein
VIAVSPVLETGEFFPTTFWLTCPWLVAVVSDLESKGAAAAWTAVFASDARAAAAAVATDLAYRAARTALGGGADPCSSVGVAGQADPLMVKCVHARVAASLAGVGDPAGDRVLADLAADGVPAECPDARCSVGGGVMSPG